ncbi:hypothetical protein AAG570_010510 [Ranatra chinensis]|uniref:[histone H4]-lysine(20) N-methyltransferase n=1 Tax=Ranatra chinensis TaxID=642074 RepID=A0ABD0YMR4_9HEMI
MTTNSIIQEHKGTSISPHRIEINSDDTTLLVAQQTDVLQGTPLQSLKKIQRPQRRRLKVIQSENESVNPNNKLTNYFPVRRSVRKTKKAVLEEIQKNFEEAVLTNREVGLGVHMFEGKGRGVVATQPFSRGDFVVEYAGELISSEEAKRREFMYSRDQNTGCYMYYFSFKNNQYCVDATTESLRLGRLVNHSRNGNLITKTVTVKGKPHLVLVAKDNINIGDELTYDYGDRSKESLQHHPWLAF